MRKSNKNVFSWFFPVIALGLMGGLVYIFRDGLFFKDGRLDFQENSVYKIALCVFFLISFVVPIMLMVFNILAKSKTKEFLNNKKLTGNSNFSRVWEVYETTFEKLEYSDEKFSRANADLYFTVESTTNFFGIPLTEVLKIISGTFIGLGILGTFIGFSNAISADFSIKSIKTIDDLNPIFSGLQTAFSSSIVGVFCSVVYNFFVVHPVLQALSDSVKELSDDIDEEYYKSETEIIVKELHKNDEKNASFVNSMNTLTKTLNVASDEFNKTVKNIRALNSELKTNIEKLQSEFKTEISKFTGKISSDLEHTFNNFEESVINFSNKINDSMLAITNSVDAVSTVPDRLEQVKNAFGGVVVKVSEQTTDAVGKIMDGVKDEMNLAASSVTDKLVCSVDQMEKNFKSISDNVCRDISSCVVSVKEKFDEVSFDIQDSLAQNVSNSIDKMNEFVHESSQIMRDEVSKATNDMSKSVNEAVFSATEDVKNLNESLNEAVVNAVESVNETAEKVSQIPERIIGITESINRLSENLVDVERDFNANVSMISEIPDRVNKFNETLKEYETHVINSMRKESETASETLEKLTEGMKIAMSAAESSASKFYDASQQARTVVDEFRKFLVQQKTEGGEMK
ncbi:MAG: hypothetical protein K6B43_08095 [Treponema sp.]|nr:hypothetical protein [Treponema sp.]